MCIKLVNRILLGLLMLVPGLLKLFVVKPTGVTSMLEGIGFPAAMLFAWILIILEVGTGLMILANWKIEWAAWPPAVILLVAVLVTTNWKDPQIPNILLHLVALWGYVMLAKCCWCGSCETSPKKEEAKPAAKEAPAKK